MPARCSVCGREFERFEDLERHEHPLPPPWRKGGVGFPCASCAAVFDTEQELVAHECGVRRLDLAEPARRRIRRRASAEAHRGPFRRWPRG